MKTVTAHEPGAHAYFATLRKIVELLEGTKEALTIVVHQKCLVTVRDDGHPEKYMDLVLRARHLLKVTGSRVIWRNKPKPPAKPRRQRREGSPAGGVVLGWVAEGSHEGGAPKWRPLFSWQQVFEAKAEPKAKFRKDYDMWLQTAVDPSNAD